MENVTQEAELVITAQFLATAVTVSITCNFSTGSKMSCALLYYEETTTKFLNSMLYSYDLKNARCIA